MKRVETISINGIVFSIEDDAYVQLGSYIDILSKHFEQETGGRDIIADIEARISELFAEREGGVGSVVTVDDVTKVIEILGAPEVITGDDANGMSESEKSQPKPQQSKKPPKRLYRDTDRRYLGGVCAGIGAWFGATPAAIRLVFVIISLLLFVYTIHSGNFFKVFPVLIYFILWIIIPKAKTTAQKLEMHGEPINISTIEKNIRESFSDPSLKRSFREFLDEAGECFTKVFGKIGRIIGFIVGLGLFFWGIVLAVGLISLFLMQDFIFNKSIEWDFLSFTELFRHIISPASYVILLVCTILAVVLFIMALLFWGMSLMSGLKLKNKLFHVAMAMVWIAAVVTGIITTVSQVRKFAWNNEPIAETRYIAYSDTIYIALTSSDLQISNNPMDIYFDKDTRIFYGKPNLYIRKSDDEQIKLRTTRKSQGESKRDAYRYAENIEYKLDIRDSMIVFHPFFTVTPSDRWKFQTLDITLFVPEGIVIVADRTLCNDRMLRRRFKNDCTWVFAE